MDFLSFFNETCRLCCMRRNERCDMISLFEGDDGRALATKITKLTGMKIEPQDGLPPVACTKCTQHINRMVQFIEICKISNKILIHLFQKCHNSRNHLSSSSTDETVVSQHLQHGSNVITPLLPVNSTSDFGDSIRSSLTVARTLVSQHNDISTFPKPANVTAVNNSPNILKPITSIAHLHKCSVSACQMAQIHKSVEDVTHNKDNQNDQLKSSDNTAVNFIPNSCSIMHHSVPSNSKNLYHKLEDRSLSSGSIPAEREYFHSTSVVRHTFETNPSKKVQEKCLAVLAQEPLCSDVATGVSKINSSVCPVNTNCKHSETGSGNKSDSTISRVLDELHDGGIDLYNKENTIQQPCSLNLTCVGKPLSNTENYSHMSSSENKEYILIHGQVSGQDIRSRLVYNSGSSVMQTKHTLPLPAQNDNDSVSVATLPSVKSTSSCDITVLNDMPQHKSGAPCTYPPPPLVPISESWKLLQGVPSYVPKTLGPVINVKKRNAPLVSSLDCSYDKECSSGMRALVQHIPSRPSVITTYTAAENHSLNKHLTPNLHRSITTTKSVSQSKPSPSIADIPASTSKSLLSPSEVSEVVRAIGSELGVFLENDDAVGNISQTIEYSASGTEYSNPQLRRNFANPDQTSGPGMLQAQRDTIFSTGQSISIPLSHRDINKQPHIAFPLPQQQFPQIVSSTSYICKAPDCVPNDYQRTTSRHVTPVNKHTPHKKRLPEEEYSARPKRRKCGQQSKSRVSRQRMKEAKCGYFLKNNLRSLLSSIKAAFPDMKIPTQEELQSTVLNSDQEKQLSLSENRKFGMLKTRKRSGKELLSTEASGVEKEVDQQDMPPEVLAPEINTERVNKLHSFRIKITKTNGKYRSCSSQKYSKFICQDAQELSDAENRQIQNATHEYRPYVKISQLKPYQLAPVVIVKRLNKFFMPGVDYRLTDVKVIDLLHKM